MKITKQTHQQSGVMEQVAVLAEEFKQLKLMHDTLDEQCKAVGVQMQKVGAELAALVERADLKPPFHLSTGGSVTIIDDISVKTEDSDAVMHWLAEHGHEDVIKQSVHPQTLKSLVKNLEKENQPLPNGVTVTTFKRAQFSKR